VNLFKKNALLPKISIHGALTALFEHNKMLICEISIFFFFNHASNKYLLFWICKKKFIIACVKLRLFIYFNLLIAHSISCLAYSNKVNIKISQKDYKTCGRGISFIIQFLHYFFSSTLCDTWMLNTCGIQM
jgi:hypothetical protein